MFQIHVHKSKIQYFFIVLFLSQIIKISQQDLYMSIITDLGVRVKVFNATFNNISVISWQSVLLVEETVVHRKNHRSVTSHCQTLPHHVVSSTPPLERDLLVIGTDCTCTIRYDHDGPKITDH